MSRTLDVCLNYDDEGDGPLSADQIAAGILRAVQPQRPSAEQLQVAGAAFDALFKRLETLPAGNIRRQGRRRRADHPHAGRPATTHSCPWD